MKTVLLVLVVLLAASAVFAEEEERHGGHGHGHGGGHGHGHEHGHHPNGPGGNYVYQACHEDFAKYCPNLHPTTAKEVFTAECFKENEQNLSPACHAALDQFRKTEGEHNTNNDGPIPIDGDGIGSGSGTGGASGTPVYQACKADQLRVCPNMPDPWTEVELFEAPCFKSHLNTISPACKNMYEKFVLNRHFLLGILVSGSVMVVASAALSLVTICCCVACCVRVCVKRRSRQCRWQKVNTSEDTELETAKSVNYDPLQQIEEAGFPQTQFVFQPQQAYTPYTTLPQYMPVFTMPAQQQ